MVRPMIFCCNEEIRAELRNINNFDISIPYSILSNRNLALIGERGSLFIELCRQIFLSELSTICPNKPAYSTSQ